VLTDRLTLSPSNFKKLNMKHSLRVTLIAVLVGAFMSLFTKINAQNLNPTYQSATYLCNLGSGPYTLNTSNSFYNPAGLDTGCLSFTKNPHWFRFQVTSPGNIRWLISPNVNVNLDVVVYGPFNDPNPGISALNASNRRYCSNRPTLLDTVQLNNVTTHEFYLLMVVSQEGLPGSFNFVPLAGNTAQLGTTIRSAFNNPTTLQSCSPPYQIVTWPAASDITNVSFSGPGVNPSTGVFDPTLAGVGVHTIIISGNPYNCGNTQSVAYTVNVIACAGVPGISNPSGQTTICHNSFAPPLNLIPINPTLLPPGVAVVGTRWEQRLAGTTSWLPVPGGNTPTLNSLIATNSMDIRVVSIRGDGVEVPSLPISFTVLAPIQVSNVSVIGGGSVVCFNTPIILQATPAVGGGNSFVYQWESKVGSGPWTDIAGATNLSYSTTATTSTSYRIEATDVSLFNCGSVYSLTPDMLITVLPQVNPGVISAGAAIPGAARDACLGENVAINTTSSASGAGTPAYLWQESADGIVWNTITPISNTANIVVLGASVPGTRYYRRQVTFTTSGITCSNPPDYSNVVIINWQDDLPFVSLKRTRQFNAEFSHPWPNPNFVAGSSLTNQTVSTVTMTTASAALNATVSAAYGLPAGIVPSDGIITFNIRTGWSVGGAAFSINVPAGATNLLQAFEINGSPINIGSGSLFSVRVRQGDALVFRTGFTNSSSTSGLVRRDTVLNFSFYPRGLNNVDSLCSTSPALPYTIASTGENSPAVAMFAATYPLTSDIAYSWTENGFGSLTNPSSLTPTYIPSPLDAGNTVVLTLTATRLSGVCASRTASVTYSLIYRNVFAGASVVVPTSNPAICVNSFPAIPVSANPATGGSGPYAYQWQESLSGLAASWTDIPGATNLVYNPTSAWFVTKYYRILTTDLGNPSCATRIPSLNNRVITVYQALSAPVFTTSTVRTCPGTSVTISASAANGGYGNFRYTFQVVDASLASSSIPSNFWPWSNVPGSVLIASPTAFLGNVWANSPDKYYRVIAQDFTSPAFTTVGCGTAWSEPVRVQAFDTVAPILNVINPTIQSGPNCSASITAAQVASYITNFFDVCHPTTVPLLNPSITPSTFPGPGSYPAVIRAFDSTGNMGMATCTVTVVDVTAPTVLTKNHTLPLNSLGQATLTPANVNNGSFDNCTPASGLVYNVNPSTFTCSNIGNNNVTLSVTDQYGNVATGTAVVSVVDNLPPSISGLPVANGGTITLNGYGNNCAANLQWTAVATDNCGTPTLNSVPAYDPCRVYLPNSPVTYTYTSVDGAGNSSTYTFTIQVNSSGCPSASTRTKLQLSIPVADTCMDKEVTVSVMLKDFAANNTTANPNLGAISLVIDYDASRLTPVTNYLINTISSIQTSDLSYSNTPGQIRIGWSNLTGINICQKDVKLFDLKFNTSCVSGLASLSFNTTQPQNNELAYINANVISPVEFIGASTNLKLCKGIQGKVSYANAVGTALAGFEVRVGTGSTIAVGTTDGNGNYLACGNPLVLTPVAPFNTYAVSVIPSPLATWSGVNATDAQRIRRHFAGFDPIAPGIRLKAGDVDLNSNVNAGDALAVQRRFAQIVNSFPAGNWVFTDTPSLIYNSLVVTRNIQALATGDVNADRSVFPRMMASTELSVVGSVESMDSYFSLPVFVEQNVRLGAASVVIELPEGIQVENVDFAKNFGDQWTWKQTGNVLRMAWSSLKPLDLRAGDELFVLGLRGLANGILKLGFETEFANLEAEVVSGLTLNAPRLVNGSLASSSVAIYPNPSNGFVKVSGTFESVIVSDIHGREVLRASSEGTVTLLDLTAQAEGIYTLSVKSSKGLETHRLVLRK